MNDSRASVLKTEQVRAIVEGRAQSMDAAGVAQMQNGCKLARIE
jgi:hypothetical protein